MYSVSPQVASLWRSLLSAIIAASGVSVNVIEHNAPLLMSDLWKRADKGAVFMCGLPFSRTEPRPLLIAAPVPLPAAYGGEPRYWSEMVVHAQSPYHSISDTFGSRIAFTMPESQSGYAAALGYLMELNRVGVFEQPLYREIIAPAVTPLGALMAVIQRQAEVAPIDSYCFALLQQTRPDLTSQVRSVAQTKATPIPLLVGSPGHHLALQTAFLEAHRNVATQELMSQLLLKQFVRPQVSHYDAMRIHCDRSLHYWRTHPLATVCHPAFALGST